ncbi:MAG TPA: hypothetical protein VK662_08415, partial [Acidothermaceae bacterium]|nr:hypothetical protein [Acidothermaceae bacterium]
MTTYDPFSTVERPKVGVFAGIPSAPPGKVLVVDQVGRALRALESPRDRLTPGEARWGQVRTLYEVDVTEHQLEFEDTFPCRDDVGGYRAVIKFACKVRDATDVVTRGTHDVSRVVVPLLTETLRRTCGEFEAEEHQAAEKASLEAVR